MNQLSGLRRHAPAQNDLLAALAKADYERLSGSLDLIPLPLGRAVYESGAQLIRDLLEYTSTQLARGIPIVRQACGVGRDSPVILEGHGGHDMVSVRVTNYGCPIPVEAPQVIFNPLVQVPPRSVQPGQRKCSPPRSREGNAARWCM